MNPNSPSANFKVPTTFQLGRLFAAQGFDYNPYTRILANGEVSRQWTMFNAGVNDYKNEQASLKEYLENVGEY